MSVGCRRNAAVIGCLVLFSSLLFAGWSAQTSGVVTDLNSVSFPEGTLVGYAVFFVRYNMHYRQSLQALQDVLFVDLAHRHSRVGLRLIEYAEDRLRDDGVQVILHHVKVNTPATVQLFLRLGYEPIDQILGKRLDR